MLVKREINKAVSPSKDITSCEHCSKFSLKILQLEDDLKSQEESQKKLQIELEHSKIIQDQQRLLYEKRIDDLKQNPYPDPSPVSPSALNKDKKLQSLNFEIKQRDSLLTKAKKLVTILSEELSQKTAEIEQLHKLVQADLQAENKKLKEKISELENSKDCQKNESFSFDTESFGSKVIKTNEKDSLCHRLESDLNFLGNQLELAQKSLKGTCDENCQLKGLIFSLEERISCLTKEREEGSQAIYELESALDESKKRQFQLEAELQDILRSNRSSLSVEDFNKIMSQKESVICELTSQVLKKNSHRRHRHNSHLKEIFELLDAVKNEIKSGVESHASLSKEVFSVFKDFQQWYRSHKFNPRSKFASEILIVLLTSAKGKNKLEVEKLVNNFQDFDLDTLENSVLKHVKLACSGKKEVLTKVKVLSGSLKIGIESIALVCEKIEELKENLGNLNESEFEGQVLDLTLGFLREFGKERETDFQDCHEIFRALV